MEKSRQVIVRAPGKINLYLDILGTDEKNYHLLNTIMHSVSLEDTVTLERTGETNISLGTTWSHIPKGEDNIAHRAALAFFRHTGIPAEGLFIHIDKKIPDQAGLGGGSSDAAAVLVGMNTMYSTKLSKQELCDIGVTIGADVPFCIVGGCALAQGIGEVITPLTPLTEGYFVLVKPLVGVNTGEAFAIYDTLKQQGEVQPLAILEDVLQVFQQQNLAEVGKVLGNVFEQALTELPTDGIKRLFDSFGALGSTLSGSGSAVAGFFETKEKAEECYKFMRFGNFAEVHLVQPISHGAVVRADIPSQTKGTA